MSKSFKVVSGQIVASDPCYDIPTWCQGILKAKNGLWETNVEYVGNRVSRISAWNVDAATNNITLSQDIHSAAEIPFVFGVDSGQFGYFDHDSYRKDEVIGDDFPRGVFDETDFPEVGGKWYGACCNVTCETKERYGVFPFGIVSSSGWGVGSYQTNGITDEDGNYIALSTTFIDQSQDDEDDSLEEDEDEDETEELE